MIFEFQGLANCILAVILEAIGRCVRADRIQAKEIAMLAALIFCAGLQDEQKLDKSRIIAVPDFAIVQLSQDQKSVAVHRKVVRQVSEKVPYTYIVTIMKTEKGADGKEKKVPVQEQRRGERDVVRTVTESAKKLYKSGEVRFLQTDGKPLPDEKVAALSGKKNLPAIILRTGQKLDPFFTRVLKPSTVVIVLPRVAVPAARLRPAIRRPVAPRKKEAAPGGEN